MGLIVATLIALAPSSSGQQRVPQTGAPRQLWPQRPGDFRSLPVPIPPADAPQQAAAADASEFVPNEVLVQFEPDVAEDARAIARAAANAVLARTLRPDGRLERLTTTLAVSDALAILQALPQVEFAEPNWIVRQDATSNDPLYTNGSLWGMYGNSTTPANVFGSQAGEAWARDLIGSNDVYVAVIDDGIDITHPDLAPNIWVNPFDPIDGMDNDGNGFIDDVNGWDFFGNDNSIFDSTLDDHGTHIAGTIGARGGNGLHVAGINWNVTIIGGKFIGPSTGDVADAIEALDYITDLKTRHGLNIVATNNSWGSPDSILLHDAIIRAARQGILFVASAGNTGSNNDAVPHYPSNYSTLDDRGSETPAGYEAVIAVAALTSTGSRPSFSNYGATTVDIGAPGSGIYSTMPRNTTGFSDGTSMAAAHVTGAAALYKSAHPSASAAEIRGAILLQGIDTPSMAGITATGKRLNVGDFNGALRLTVDDVRLTEGSAGTKNFTFTVTMNASSGAPVAVTYQTQNGTALSGGGSNTAPMAVPGSGNVGNASPYPSTIAMPAGLGTVTSVQVVLTGLTHAVVADVDVLLVGPAGQTCVLMSDVGSGAAANLTITFDDSGAALPIGSPVSSGTYRPTNNGFGDFFGGSAPPGPHGSTLSLFNGTNPAGTWRLFVVDDLTGSANPIGRIAGGWSLVLTTTGADYTHTAGVLTFPAGSISQPVSVPVIGDTTFEPAESFVLALTSAAGATVDDDEGLATIVNDDFTDSVLSGQPIRAVHVIELRSAIDELRTTRGLAPFPFTDTLTPQSTTVRAIHVAQLRQALNEVYAAAGLTPPAYTDSVLTPGVTVVKAVHIAEIRDGVTTFP